MRGCRQCEKGITERGVVGDDGGRYCSSECQSDFLDRLGEVYSLLERDTLLYVLAERLNHVFDDARQKRFAPEDVKSAVSAILMEIVRIKETACVKERPTQTADSAKKTD